ncbi:ATP-dependent DNA helicase RecG [Helicobacter cynogastricus]|uniref:ATP-dependent DNA helicase RecG n=1 Tax=Helicobacter cynogastricus TaxID=329937 RepID=UPI000CF04B36|nr:ATP-dependent DNA helicase RecG [Helicobacter cynogastricus]
MPKIIEETDLNLSLPLSDFLQLLLQPPKGYTAYTLLETLQIGQEGCLEVRKLGTHAGKILKIKALALAFNQEIDLICFNYTPYHSKAFSQSRYFVYGKISVNPYSKNLQIVNPTRIDQPQSIALHFKPNARQIPAFKEQKTKNYQAFCLSVIHANSLAKLTQIGIPAKIIDALERIFYPTLEFVEQFKAHKGFFGIYLQALKYIEAFVYMRALNTKKWRFQSKFSGHANLETLQNFLTALPFTLTSDQQKAIANIQTDMQGEMATKRLIMGDVGCGKTIVILASVALTFPYKSLLMAPTSVLAKQLYQEALKFLPPYIKVSLLLGGNTSKKIREEVNQSTFIVGTTTLLYASLDTKEVGLVISDEQHRFGSKQRHDLELYARSEIGGLVCSPHYLQFSATPIPRTLAMMEAKFIKTTLIKNKPYAKDIATILIDKTHFQALLRHIHAQINSSKQVAIIYPLVEESVRQDYMSLRQAENYWKTHFEGVYTASGKDANKEEILESFAKEGHILLATTLIEVGISLPKLSTIVIVGPERLGLATLHQLRGRVARLGGKGYCFLFTHHIHDTRLRAFSQTLDGFEIANLDLKHRSAGDLLQGTQQSGAHFDYLDLATDQDVIAQASILF